MRLLFPLSPNHRLLLAPTAVKLVLNLVSLPCGPWENTVYLKYRHPHSMAQFPYRKSLPLPGGRASALDLQYRCICMKSSKPHYIMYVFGKTFSVCSAGWVILVDLFGQRAAQMFASLKEQRHERSHLWFCSFCPFKIPYLSISDFCSICRDIS
jgi:hypothetical protein